MSLRMTSHWQHGPHTPLSDSSGTIATGVIVHPCWCLDGERELVCAHV